MGRAVYHASRGSRLRDLRGGAVERHVAAPSGRRSASGRRGGTASSRGRLRVVDPGHVGSERPSRGPRSETVDSVYEKRSRKTRSATSFYSTTLPRVTDGTIGSLEYSQWERLD